HHAAACDRGGDGAPRAGGSHRHPGRGWQHDCGRHECRYGRPHGDSAGRDAEWHDDRECGRRCGDVLRPRSGQAAGWLHACGSGPRLRVGWLDGCGITTVGAVYCWGSDYFGQLGDGDSTDQAMPVPVAGTHVFTSHSAGLLHACGVVTGGAGYCWGNNVSGQLGSGDTVSSTTPVAVAGGLTFSSISSNGYHTCSVTTNHAAYCWGWNINNALGDSGTETI